MNPTSDIVFVGEVGETLVIIARDESYAGAPPACRGRGSFPVLPPGRYTVKRYLMAESLPYLGEVRLEITRTATAGLRDE